MLENENLVLRALEPEDVDLLYEWENDIKLWQFSNTLTPFSRFQLKQYIEASSLDLYQTKQLRLIIELSDSDRSVVGMIDLFDFDPYHQRAGVGIMVHEKWRKRGFAGEALSLFTAYCEQHLGLHQIYCNISKSNKPSIALFEAAGFKLIGNKKDWLKTKNAYEDELMYQKIL